MDKQTFIECCQYGTDSIDRSNEVDRLLETINLTYDDLYIDEHVDDDKIKEAAEKIFEEK